MSETKHTELENALGRALADALDCIAYIATDEQLNNPKVALVFNKASKVLARARGEG